MTFNIQQYLIDNKTEFRKAGKNVGSGNVNICCLWCGEGRFHLSISLKKDVFSCWICGEKGNYEKLLSKLLNISYIEAKQIINPISDLKKALEDRDTKHVKVEEIKKIKKFELPAYTKPFIKDSVNIWQEIMQDFLIDKYNLAFQDIIDAKLHYCIGGKYRNRIIIPIYVKGKLVSFLARSWDKNSNIKYLNCPNEESLINMKKLVYNLDNITKDQNLIIVEGVFDCIKIKPIFSNVIATLGTEVTQEQKNLIINLKAKNLLILADNDINNSSTKEKAKELVDYFSAFTNSKYIEVPFKGKDPADLTKVELANLISRWYT